MDKNYGFVRVAAATPKVKVADCGYNTDEILELIIQAEKNEVSVVVFPELSITAYTCADLFHQYLLLSEAENALKRISDFLRGKETTAIVGLPIIFNNHLFNVAAVINDGRIKGFVPKTYLPNYNEFYEKRWFTSSQFLSATTISFLGQEIPVGIDLIFKTPTFNFGVEICEDLWTPIPPSSYLSLNGADVIFNLSASNEIVGKASYRRMLVGQQSARCICGYVYASAGAGESTTDLVFGGHNLIAEDGVLLGESKRFSMSNELLIADVDVEHLRAKRIQDTSFINFSNKQYRVINIDSKTITHKLHRKISSTPFVPDNMEALNNNCDEIFMIQTNGLAKRMLHTGLQIAVIGVSGGLDSTLALLVLVRTFDLLNIPRQNIYGITMPGFGTTGRTYNNAIKLMQALGVTIKEIPINKAVIQHFEDIGQDINVHDVTYENSQARERTQILMDYANKVNGLVIGTGDLSELALGWCTYNGDQMSMYGVNAGVPKTLVRILVAWVANNHMDVTSRDILLDIVDTPVSPELLPADKDGNMTQITEDVVGPYILHDFFLYYMFRFGFTPAKIYFLAKHAFDDKYKDAEILKWMKVFYRRFFSQQFKRSCMPDGPKIGSVNLSPRGDWRMPSDAAVTLWMRQLDEL